MRAGRSFISNTRFVQEGEAVAGVALGHGLPLGNPARQTLDLYRHGAGIETGYGFFAPNVPDNYKLVFELHYNDGCVEITLPTVSGAASGVRIVDLLDRLSQIEYPPLRELMVRMLAYQVWREHPDAIAIRAIFGFVSLPSLEAFRLGEKESYQTMFAYDFGFRPPAPQPEP